MPYPPARNVSMMRIKHSVDWHLMFRLGEDPTFSRKTHVTSKPFCCTTWCPSSTALACQEISQQSIWFGIALQGFSTCTIQIARSDRRSKAHKHNSINVLKVGDHLFGKPSIPYCNYLTSNVTLAALPCNQIKEIPKLCYTTSTWQPVKD